MARFKKGVTPKGAKPFTKGKSGNPNGRPRKLPDLDELLADVLGKEIGRTSGKRTQAEAIILSLTQQAIKGNVRAAEVLLERAYGKPKQDVEQKTILYSVEVTAAEAKELGKGILKDI